MEWFMTSHRTIREHNFYPSSLEKWPDGRHDINGLGRLIVNYWVRIRIGATRKSMESDQAIA